MKQIIGSVLICFLSLFLLGSGCIAKQQERVTEAQKAVEVPDKAHFFERQQTAKAEIINDRPGKVYFWYILLVQTALNNACGDYQARWDNVFHSMAAPGDIPRSCESIR